MDKKQGETHFKDEISSKLIETETKETKSNKRADT